MKSIIRVAVVAVVFGTAGCVVSNADVAQVSAPAPAESHSVFGEMHAAIPASKTDTAFEYN
jgi:hypothetical protein